MGRDRAIVLHLCRAVRRLRLATPLLALLALACFSYRSAEGLPSYARQTGQQCAACHNGFPELTPYGRLFKLNGYTFTGGTNNWPALAAMAIPNFTHTATDQPGVAPGFGPNDNLAFTGSLFYGGRIADHLGIFSQVTYDQVGNQISWDNLDLRYANVGSLFGNELLYGVSLNNNPTVDDAWNSTPAWSFPFVGSDFGPTPAAGTLIEGGLAQQVIGLDPYVFWHRLVYLEVGGYRTLGPWSLSALGVPPAGTSAIDGLAPNWRLAVEPQWGNSSWEFGTFGLAASLVPQRMVGTDHLTDIGVDTQYQWLGARDSFSVQARYIHEAQNLAASEALGLAARSSNSLGSFNLKGSYYYKQTVGLTLAYFRIDGSPDPLAYGGSPNSSGEIAELDYMPFNYGGPSFWPWLNVKFGLQYVHYNTFNGTSNNASGNDALYAFTWIMF